MNRIASNILWLGFERVTTILGTLIITIYTARYLGPEKMGLIHFSLALIALIIPISQLGSDAIIFNRIAKKYKSGVELIKYSMPIRILTYILLCTFLLVGCTIAGYAKTELTIIFLMMVSSFFSSQDVYKIYYDATLRSKINTVTSQVGLLISLGVRASLVSAGANFILFTIPYILNTGIPYFIKLIKYRKENKLAAQDIERSKKQRGLYSAYLLRNGGPLVISGVSVVVYTQIGLLMLGSMIGLDSVGIYNSAYTIASGWAFLPMLFMTSLLPGIISDKENTLLGLSFVHLIALTLSIPIITTLSIFSSEIILYTYGVDYIDAAKLLTLLSLSTMFAVFGVISTRAIIISGGYRFVMIKTIFMAAINIFLTYIMIDHYGWIGAGFSILLTEIVSFSAANYFFKNGMVLRVHLNVFSSFKYAKNLLG